MSIVVMAYRNENTIVRAVRSVVDQADDDVEVLVVTSGGGDTASLVGSAFPDVVVVESPERLLPGATRNRGVEASRGTVVAFLEGDCLAEPGWVERRRQLHDAGHAVVACAVTNGHRRSGAAWGFHFGTYADRLGGRRAGWVPADDGAAHGCSFERSVLERIGPFDESMRIGEDTEASAAVGRTGTLIWYEPSVRTKHWGPSTTRALVADCYRRGCLRGATRGPVAGTWTKVARVWVRTARRIPSIWRAANGDRWWFLASLPWWLLGVAARLVGNQRVGRALREPDRRP